ncbi:uncharacterized protein MAM_02287 [Metarhizium album ARSEF 1941]|uniref:Gag protein n=1 Tax=Metarhizium album (strain ARSEF 1941) TaxID=1081103 RepID=A0A0B2X292_METAS|nr:uncharacterized protein MAM_02287 [Metarhizium album ARSEF 1941]KHO00364.1 hypothetical protein MAM_02287 [Metarhizium album ARSEF 1941]
MSSPRRRVDQELDDTPRLDPDDVDVQIAVSSAVGSGAYYASIPKLKGSSNWAEWDEALNVAAMGEFVIPILDGLQQPSPPAEPCSGTAWNNYVQQLAYWQRRNYNLMAGIRRSCTPYMAEKIRSETMAYKAYMTLHKHSQRRGANILGEIIGFTTDNLQKHSDVQDFVQAFREKLHNLERMQLNWTMPKELCQLLFLINLDDTFSTFRSRVYQQYRIAGVGNGADITLDQLIELAQDEHQRLETEKRLSSRSGSAIVDPSVYLAQGSTGYKHRRDTTGANQPPWKRTKLTKPSDYKGPYQKVCTIHGWLPTPGSHNDSECNTRNKQRALKAAREQRPTAYNPEADIPQDTNAEAFLAWPGAELGLSQHTLETGIKGVTCGERTRL